MMVVLVPPHMTQSIQKLLTHTFNKIVKPRNGLHTAVYHALQEGSTLPILRAAKTADIYS